MKKKKLIRIIYHSKVYRIRFLGIISAASVTFLVQIGAAYQRFSSPVPVPITCNVFMMSKQLVSVSWMVVIVPNHCYRFYTFLGLEVILRILCLCGSVPYSHCDIFPAVRVFMKMNVVAIASVAII